MNFSIGEAASAAGCKVQTVRYYEQIGLLSAVARTAGNQRVYSDGSVSRLAFIRHARALGFSLDDVRQMLSLSDKPAQSCEEIDAIARERLAEVNNRIRLLTNLKTELEHMISACAGGDVADCRIVQALSDHDNCDHDHHPAS